MVQVTKQTAPKSKSIPPKTKAPASIVDQIAPITMDGRGMKTCIYGKSGTGKTTLACDFPKPLLLIGAEDGQQSVHNVKGVDFVSLTRSDDLLTLAQHIGDSEKYLSVALDTLGAFFDICFMELLNIEEMPATRSWGMASRAQWQQCNTQVIAKIRKLLDLAALGINITILAQERVYGNDNEEDRGELLMPYVAGASTPGVIGWLNPACDYIVNTFIRQKTKENSVTMNGKTSTQKVKVKGVEYCLRTGPDPIYTTKFRVPKGSPLPEVLVDPSYEKIRKLIQGG